MAFEVAGTVEVTQLVAHFDKLQELQLQLAKIVADVEPVNAFCVEPVASTTE